MRLRALLAATLLAAACSGEKPPAKPAEPPPPALGAGEKMLAVPGGSIWYRVSGGGKGRE